MNPKLYIQKIIRIRKRLLKNNRSYKNSVLVLNDIEFLEKHLAANHYNDKTIASFFIRHSDRIYNLIPGCGCKINPRLNAEFYELLNYCKTLL